MQLLRLQAFLWIPSPSSQGTVEFFKPATSGHASLCHIFHPNQKSFLKFESKASVMLLK
jgi:hypothetical protein